MFLRLLADDKGFAADVTKKAGAAGDQAGKTLGSRMGQAASRLSVGAGAAIGTFVAGSVQEFAKFEEGMNEVFTLMPGITADAMGQMSDDVKAFSKETGKLPEEVIPALYQAISAGVPPDNVFDFLRVANKGAVAGVASTADEVSLLSAVTKGFGDTSAEAVTKAADLAQLQVKLGQTTIPELSASYGKAVPLAAALGVSQEELAASSASLFGVTGNTAEVMTQLKSVFDALIRQNPKLTAGLKKMGFETSQQAIETIGLQATLDGLAEATGGSTQELQAMLGSSEAVTAALALTGAQSETFTSNLEAMADSTGTVDAGFERMESGVAAKTRKILAGIKVFAIEVGENLKDLGPLFTLFGPAAGRAIGAGLGAAFGFAAPKVAGLFKTLLGKVFGSAVISTAAAAGGEAIGDMTSKQIAKRLAGTAAVNAMAGGLSDGLIGVEKSPKVAGATRRVGTALGGRLGKFIGVGLAATVGLVIVDTFLQINQGIQQQTDDIGENLANQINQGAIEGLEQSKAALEKGIEDLKFQAFLGNPFAGAQAAQLMLQLDKVNAELARRAAGGAAQVPPAVAEELEDGASTVSLAADELVAGIPESIVDAARAAGEAAEDTPRQIADGILSEQGAVEDAMAALQRQMEEEVTGSKAAWATIGTLVGEELAEGLEDSRPGVKAVAQDVVDTSVEELEKFIEGGGRIGDKAMAKLRDAIENGTPQQQRAAQHIVDLVEGTLDDLPPAAGQTGRDTGTRFADGMKGTRTGVQTAANSIAKAAAGITQFNDNAYGWGTALIRTFAAGMTAARAINAVVSASNTVANVIANILRPGSPPKEGPASTLDEWFPGLMRVFVSPANVREGYRIVARGTAGAMAGFQAPGFVTSSTTDRLASVAPSIAPRSAPSLTRDGDGAEGVAQPLIGQLNVTGGLPVETIRDIDAAARAVGERHRLPPRRRELLYPARRR